MISKVLVANRGEIACRVIRACRALGLQTVAVHSSADEQLLHCKLADESVYIGPAPAIESYLRGNRILEAARATGADAIHPGYGFLSESSDFARDVVDAGLTWVGPSPQIMSTMADKSAARRMARACGVPLLPGTEPVDVLDAGACQQAAQELGYPLLVKATAGGGGIGMRRVDRPDQLMTVASAASEMARKSFGDGRVYLERYVGSGRHIEIQVFGFGAGRAVHVFDRDCSAQRRFQKIVEEAPSVGLQPAVMESMCAAAVTLAQRLNYVGPGTVEFLVDNADQAFYFLEMNTRIQVEHRVSELISGLDLVQMQLLSAAARPMPLQQHEICREGAALECRLYAENVAKSFVPSPGTLQKLRFPTDMEGLFVESGYREGDLLTPYYDPMIAKLITHGTTRERAIEIMRSALAQVVVEGVHTNLALLTGILSHATFIEGRIDTGFVEREKSALILQAAPTYA